MTILPSFIKRQDFWFWLATFAIIYSMYLVDGFDLIWALISGLLIFITFKLFKFSPSTVIALIFIGIVILIRNVFPKLWEAMTSII